MQQGDGSGALAGRMEKLEQHAAEAWQFSLSEGDTAQSRTDMVALRSAVSREQALRQVRRANAARPCTRRTPGQPPRGSRCAQRIDRLPRSSALQAQEARLLAEISSLRSKLDESHESESRLSRRLDEVEAAQTFVGANSQMESVDSAATKADELLQVRRPTGRENEHHPASLAELHAQRGRFGQLRFLTPARLKFAG